MKYILNFAFDFIFVYILEALGSQKNRAEHGKTKHGKY